MGPYIDPWQLHIVLVVAEELNTVKAALRLKVNQSTVSKGIRQFEKKQELTVFVRDGKRIAGLTPEGRGFLESIKPAFQAFQIEAARASDIAEMILRKSAGTFMFGYSPLAPAAMLSEVRSVRSVRFPALRLQVRQLKPSEIFVLVRSGLLQVGLTYAFPLRHDLVQIRVGEEPMCAVYPRKPGARPAWRYLSKSCARSPSMCCLRIASSRSFENAWYRNVPGEDSLRRLRKKRIPRDRLSISCLIEEASPSCPSACMLEHRQI